MVGFLWVGVSGKMNDIIAMDISLERKERIASFVALSTGFYCVS